MPDPEAPEADALDQSIEVTEGRKLDRLTRDPEAPEADALEQAMVEPLDEE